MTFYVTRKEKVLFWGKLSECVTFIGEVLPRQAGCDITYKDNLTLEQQEWLHKIKKNLHSSANIQ